RLSNTRQKTKRKGCNEMRGLAWDDEPNEYVADLQEDLGKLGVHLEITSSEDDFASKFAHGNWDFIVTDLVEESISDPEGDSDRGVRIARRTAAKGLPVFILTKFPQRITSEELDVPDSVIIRSKTTLPAWMAQQVIADLKKLGIFVNR